MPDQPSKNLPSNSDPDPGIPLNYRTQRRVEDPSSNRVGLFLIGLFAGVVASGLAYAATFKSGPGAASIAVVLLLAAKISLGSYLASKPRKSAIGVGILFSIGLVMLLTGVGVGYLAYRCFNP